MIGSLPTMDIRGENDRPPAARDCAADSNFSQEKRSDDASTPHAESFRW